MSAMKSTLKAGSRNGSVFLSTNLATTLTVAYKALNTVLIKNQYKIIFDYFNRSTPGQ